MSAMSHVWRQIAEGLMFGFTFALGWFAAVLTVGVVLA